MRDFARSDSPEVQAQLDRLARLSVPSGRLGLEAIRALLARLGDPQRAMPPALHVAGTNGKGSTCAFLRAMLEADGYRVHQFTSPHLVNYNERIRIGGRLIADALLAALLKEVLDASGDIGASFFEVTTAAAFLAFARHPADACVIEVGLGGRFDATNVLDHPTACGIASLALDHESFLLAFEAGTPADPIARIAFEKAGIARPGVPLVTQHYPPAASAQIAAVAEARNATLVMRGTHWQAEAEPEGIAYRDGAGALDLPLPALLGAHQADNAALAVAMLRHQQALRVSAQAMAAGICDARWPARLQRLGCGPLTDLLPKGAEVLLDGGHNPDAAAALARALSRGPQVDLVMGLLDNRRIAEFLAPLKSIVARLWAVPIPGHDHHPPEAIRAAARDAGISNAEAANDVASAFSRIAASAGSETRRVVVCGSLYLAGAVLRDNREIPD